MPESITQVKKDVIQLGLAIGKSPQAIADAACVSIATVYRRKANQETFNSLDPPKLCHQGKVSHLSAEAIEVKSCMCIKALLILRRVS
jgi:transposase